MEHVRTFLQTSSIHGLIHIPRSRKFKQLIWVVTVFVGFSSAFILISTSFESWRKSPVRTVTETVPISEIRLPKVTVCPPKNTFTDLNYDLSRAEDIQLTDAKRHELTQFAIENAEENSYMDALNHLQEENRFYNWYHGYSSVEPPREISSSFIMIVKTSALSGSIETVDYGHEYEPNLVWNNVNHQIFIKSNSENPNATLNIEVEKISMTGLTNGKDFYRVGNQKHLWVLDEYRNYMHSKFNILNDWYFFNADRKDVSIENIRNLDLKQMPGFRFKWYYTGANLTRPRQLESEHNMFHKEFIRLLI